MFDSLTVNDVLKFLVIATLCVATIVILTKCFLNPDNFEKLKELVMSLVVGFVGLVNRWSASDATKPTDVAPTLPAQTDKTQEEK